jgi:Predicted membrane protein
MLSSISLYTPIKRLPIKNKTERVTSIDLLRGTVMIIMAVDHVRDYFHNSAFLYDPTDLKHTTVPLFFTRWITHFCAPIFVFLAGVSANLYGSKRSKKELSWFLFSRGLWLIFAEMFIITLEWSFNPSYHYFFMQVIWVTGFSMMLLSGLVYLNSYIILITGLVIILTHNLLDGVHVSGNGLEAFLWSLFHEPGNFRFGHYSFLVRYSFLPWLGIISIGYFFGSFYNKSFDAELRKKILFVIGLSSIVLFITIRSFNNYGDLSHWQIQKNAVFTFLSILNVTKYPPSLLYILMTVGPALIFLAIAEFPLSKWTSRISIFGRVPFFFYVLHIALIHALATIAAIISGYNASAMILKTRVNQSPELKDYGFNLIVVFIIWIAVILILYPLCKWFDKYKRNNIGDRRWLSYL